MTSKTDRVCIIGAGPAGLTAAYTLSQSDIRGTILESDDVVGGIARTVVRNGYRFDIGGHRFFTKVKAIERLWEDMLGEPMLVRPRLSRIFYGGKFYDYPLRASNALKNMGVFTAGLCLLSYARARLFPIKNARNFEQWVTNHFGKRLFRMFFKSYTEKVWGCACSDIGADWAAQRIKSLTLGKAVAAALFKQRGGSGGKKITSLIEEFKYPRHGPGQLWEKCADTVCEAGWNLEMSTRVVSIKHEEGQIYSIHSRDRDGTTHDLEVDQVMSSMPLREFVLALDPPPPPQVLSAAHELTYRDFLTVALVLDKADTFPDNWIYIHSPDVRVGRIQNFGNWSPEMLADRTTSCLGMEYFVTQGDDLWESTDSQLIERAFSELKAIQLDKGAQLLQGHVVRVPKAYPVYDPGYQERLNMIRHWLSDNLSNLHCIGRNGQHRYNNQDHSMATAMIAAANIVSSAHRDPWSVNEDAEYHEVASTERWVPAPVAVPA